MEWRKTRAAHDGLLLFLVGFNLFLVAFLLQRIKSTACPAFRLRQVAVQLQMA